MASSRILGDRRPLHLCPVCLRKVSIPLSEQLLGGPEW